MILPFIGSFNFFFNFLKWSLSNDGSGKDLLSALIFSLTFFFLVTTFDFLMRSSIIFVNFFSSAINLPFFFFSELISLLIFVKTFLFFFFSFSSFFFFLSSVFLREAIFLIVLSIFFFLISKLFQLSLIFLILLFCASEKKPRYLKSLVILLGLMPSKSICKDPT